MSNNFGFLQELLNTVADTSRGLIARRLFTEADAKQGLQALVDALMKGQGEATGMAIANQLLRHYQLLDRGMRVVFFKYLGEVLKPDPDEVKAAVAAEDLREKQRARQRRGVLPQGVLQPEVLASCCICTATLHWPNRTQGRAT